MIGRVAMVALAVGLSACAGLEPAGRNAARSPRPTNVASAPAPTPPRPVATTPAPAPAQTPPAVVQQPTPAPVTTAAPQRVTPPPAPSVAAPRVTAPPSSTSPSVAAPNVAAPASTSPAPSAPRPASDNDDVIVPGQTQVPAPRGDTRSNEERMADIRAWDQCVMQVQNAFDADPMRPQLTTPEEYCRTSLGMNERTAVPISRRRR